MKRGLRTGTAAARPVALLLAGLGLVAAACTHAPQRNAAYKLPAAYNFAFYDTHPEAARSFYAAHFAHFGIYEMLLDHGEDAGAEMEELHRQILDYVENPPIFEPPAEIIAPDWSKIAYETGGSMDWTHMLHSQLYDILTDDSVVDKKAAGERAMAYYLDNPHSAFSTRGYGHRWMEGGGEWAGAFRRKYPDLNGILWAYHWHHAAVYEALMEPDPEQRRVELDRVIAVFEDSVLMNPPEEMPLTAEVAPRFSALFPAAAHVFDNLHMMHDVVNDIMADERLTVDEKAAEIERMRTNMRYLAQETVVAPGMPMGEDHAMGDGSMRVPTRLPDGSWLPQGHPDARMASMEELMMPMGGPPAGPVEVRPPHVHPEVPVEEPEDEHEHGHEGDEGHGDHEGPGGSR